MILTILKPKNSTMNLSYHELKVQKKAITPLPEKNFTIVIKFNLLKLSKIALSYNTPEIIKNVNLESVHIL